MHHLCSGLAALLAHHHVRVRQKEREGEKDGERGRERGIASDQYRRRGRTSQADSRWARSGLPEFHTPLCVCHPKRPEGGDHPRKRVETRNYANRSRNRGKTVVCCLARKRSGHRRRGVLARQPRDYSAVTDNNEGGKIHRSSLVRDLFIYPR